MRAPEPVQKTLSRDVGGFAGINSKPVTIRMQLSKAQLLVGERFTMSFVVDNTQSKRDLTSMRVRLV